MQTQNFNALESSEDFFKFPEPSFTVSPSRDMKVESDFEMQTSLAFWNQTLSAIPLNDTELQCSLVPRSFEVNSELEKVTTC